MRQHVAFEGKARRVWLTLETLLSTLRMLASRMPPMSMNPSMRDHVATSSSTSRPTATRVRREVKRSVPCDGVCTPPSWPSAGTDACW